MTNQSESIGAFEKAFVTLTGFPLWEAVGLLAKDFPQSAIKERTGSGGKLSSINPAYEIERLNMVFGLCGFGWKYKNGEFTIHPAREGGKIEAYVVTEVVFQFAYTYAEPTIELPYQVLWSEPIPACGQGSVHSGMAIGDAHKSAVTDALTKAASMIGVGISVFKGEQTHRSAPRETKPTPKQKCAAAIRNRKAILDSSETWSPEQTREQKQKVAQKRADAEALVKDVADTLGAEIVTADKLDIRVNDDYKTRQPEIPPVKIEARFLRTQGRAKVYTLLEDGQDVGELFLPATQIAKVGRDADGKEYVWVSTWIADKKIKEGKLQPEQIIWKEHDEARGDAWEEEIAKLPPDDSDVPL